MAAATALVATHGFSVVTYSQEMSERDDEAMEYYQMVYDDLKRRIDAAFPNVTQAAIKDELAWWHILQLAYCNKRLTERVKAAMEADKREASDFQVQMVIKAMKLDSSHPYGDLLKTIRQTCFMTMARYNVDISDHQLVVPRRDRFVRFSPAPDFGWSCPALVLPEPFNTCEQIVETVYARTMKVVKFREKYAQEKEPDTGNAWATYPTHLISDSDLLAPICPVTYESTPLHPRQQAGKGPSVFNTSDSDIQAAAKDLYPFRGKALRVDIDRPVILSPTFDKCVYSADHYGIRATFLSLDSDQQGISYLFPTSESPPVEDDDRKQCLLECASLKVGKNRWDMLAFYVKTVSTLAVKSVLQVVAFNGQTFLPVGRLADKDIPGSPAVLTISQHADCLALITEDDADIILVYRWPMTVVRRELDIFQKCVVRSARPGDELPFPKDPLCQLALVRRIQPPVSILNTVQLSRMGVKVFTESHPDGVAEVPGEETAYPTTLKLSETVKKIAAKSSKLASKSTVRSLLKEVSLRKWPSFHLTSCSPDRTSTTSYATHLSTRGVCVLYKSTRNHLYSFAVPATPLNVIDDHRADKIELLPAAVRQTFFNRDTEWLACLTEKRCVVLFDKRKGHFITSIAVPDSIGAVRDCLLLSSRAPDVVTGSDSDKAPPQVGAARGDAQAKEQVTSSHQAMSSKAKGTATVQLSAKKPDSTKPSKVKAKPALPDCVVLVGGESGQLARCRVKPDPMCLPCDDEFKISSNKKFANIERGEIVNILPAGAAYPQLVYCCYSNRLIALHDIATGDIVQFIYPLDFQEFDMSKLMTTSNGECLCIRCWESIAVKHLDLANEETWKRYTIKMQVGETSWRAKHDSLVGRMGSCQSFCTLKHLTNLSKYHRLLPDQAMVSPAPSCPVLPSVLRRTEKSWNPLSQFYGQREKEALEVPSDPDLLEFAQQQKDGMTRAMA